MICTYDDVVKTTEERYIFQHVGAKDIDKAITIKERNGNTYGGYIIETTDSEIIYAFNSVKTILNAKTLYDNKDTKICIYDPNTGQHDVYDAEVFVKRSKEKREFNTNILKPSAKFYMEANGRCGIVTVVDCGKNRLCLREDGFIGGIRYFGIYETICGQVIPAIPNPIQLKTLDEITCYDLVKRGFNGYSLKPSTVFEIIKILESEEVKPFDDEEDSTIE